MQYNKLVSVIVPVYNVEQYLERSIKSILSQTYRNIEIILVNDGSTDSSARLCDNYASSDSRIKVMHKPNGGVSSARNSGMREARGDYISFVDPDDWLAPDAIMDMVELIEMHNVDLVRTQYYLDTGELHSRHDSNIHEGLYTAVDREKLLAKFLSGEESCFVVVLLVKNDFIKKLGNFNESLHMMEDTCFYVNFLTKLNSIYISNIATYHYCLNPSSASLSTKYYSRNANNIIVVNKIIKQILKQSNLATGYLIQLVNLTHVNLVTNYLFLFYKNVPNSKNAIIELFEYLRKSAAYMNMVDGIDRNRLPFHVNYTIGCVVNNNLNSMLRFFKVRLLASRLRAWVLHV